MRKITLEARFPAPADEVWRLARRSDTLTFIAAPLLTFQPIDGPFPEVWAEGQYEARMRFLGLVPLGRQTIDIRHGEGPDGTRTIRDAGRGQIVKVWNHLITIAPEGDGARYTDEVTIDAGLLTLPVALFARAFYAHRQRRWRRLLGRG